MGTVWQPPGESVPRVVLTSVPEFVAAAPQGPGSREIFEEWLNDAELRVHNGLAQVWSHYGARFGDPGEIMSWEGIDSMTLLEHDGRWRVLSIAYVADH
jgi:hypothetical protein